MQCFQSKPGSYRLSSLRSERGTIFPYLCVAAAIVALIALLLMSGLGNAIILKKTARNAADAAALAAAENWSRSIKKSYEAPMNSGEQQDNKMIVGRDVISYSEGNKEAAINYASLNDAEVVDYKIDRLQGTVTVTVATTSFIQGNKKKMYATSTAKLIFAEGICLDRGKIGLQMEKSCISQRKYARNGTSGPRSENDPHTRTSTGSSSDPSQPAEKSMHLNGKKVRVYARLI